MDDHAPDLTKNIPVISDTYELPKRYTRDLLKVFHRLKQLATDHDEKEMTDLYIRLQQGENANNTNGDAIAQVSDDSETLRSNDKQVCNPSTTTRLMRYTRNLKKPTNTTTSTTVDKNPEDIGHTIKNLQRRISAKEPISSYL